MLLKFSRKPWVPGELFSLGEIGAWYDPSDLSTMFQDSAGTTPVTAAGQPVGLVLDKSKGLTLGPELVADPGFDSPSAWTPQDANWVVSGGKASYADISLAYLQSNADISIVAGKTYKVQFELVDGTPQADMAFLALFNKTASVNYFGGYIQFTSNGLKQVIFTAAASSTGIRIYGNAGGRTPWGLASFSIKELQGNHASQATSASRPVLGRHPITGRRNLLTYTEAITTAPWSIYNSGNGSLITGVGAPDGTLSAIGLNDTSGAGYFGVNCDSPVLSVASYTLSFYVKQGTNATGFSAWLVGDGGPIYFQDTINWVAGVPTKTGWTAVAVGNGWYRVSYTFASTTAELTAIYLLPAPTSPAETGSTYFWGVQLELGSSATAYQKVVSTYDVTESGVGDAWHLAFDGVDDSLATSAIDFTATDKMSVFSGVKADVGTGTYKSLFGLGDTNSYTGRFALNYPNVADGSTARADVSGLTLSAIQRNFASGYTQNLVSLLISLTGTDQLVVRKNGSVVVSSGATSSGGGAFANVPFGMGISSYTGGASPYYGKIYSLIVRGALSTAAEIAAAEAYVNSKTGAY